MELTNLIEVSICVNNYIIYILLGQPNRRSYRPSLKLATVEEAEVGMYPDEVDQNFNVSTSNVTKWVQQKKKLIDAAKSEYKNCLKIRRATKYVNLHKALEKKFKECRAKGCRISFDERSSWHKNVHVFFQENAWVDTKVAVDWVKKTLKPTTEHLKTFVLFADNLTGQVHDDFKQSVSDCSGVVRYYGLPDATNIWQPVDVGYAKMLKILMEQ